jgi:soluble lytic murein transglycosylase-like protein
MDTFSVYVTRSVFAVAMIFGVLALTPCEAEHTRQPELKSPFIKVKISLPPPEVPWPSVKEDKMLLYSEKEEPIPSIKERRVRICSGKRAERLFHPIILQAASQHKVDPALIKAIIMAESGYDPQAISKKGARGLMQLMPRTAEALGVEDTFNPHHNINAGVKYFTQLLKQFKGDVTLALAAYNAGSRRVIESQGIPPIKATQLYIKKVFEYYHYYKKEMAGEIDNV